MMPWTHLNADMILQGEGLFMGPEQWQWPMALKIKFVTENLNKGHIGIETRMWNIYNCMEMYIWHWK